MRAYAAATAAESELPIFDPHLYYSHDAWHHVPSRDAVALLLDLRADGTTDRLKHPIVLD